MEKVSVYLDHRKFEKASSLGYNDISSEFIFLQRCLDGLNDTVRQKDKLIQDICIEILPGKKTSEKLQSLQKIRHTPIENQVENILASAMQKDEKYWQELENRNPSIPKYKVTTQRKL